MYTKSENNKYIHIIMMQAKYGVTFPLFTYYTTKTITTLLKAMKIFWLSKAHYVKKKHIMMKLAKI